jgi:hypothetical protein
MVGLRQADGMPHDSQRASIIVITFELMMFGHFMVTKHIQITEDDHRQQAFAIAKPAGNRHYPQPTTMMV